MLDTQVHDPSHELRPVDPVAIAKHTFHPIHETDRLDHLLRRPPRARVLGDVDVEHASPIVGEHDEAVENTEGRGRHREE